MATEGKTRKLVIEKYRWGLPLRHYSSGHAELKAAATIDELLHRYIATAADKHNGIEKETWKYMPKEIPINGFTYSPDFHIPPHEYLLGKKIFLKGSKDQKFYAQASCVRSSQPKEDGVIRLEVAYDGVIDFHTYYWKDSNKKITHKDWLESFREGGFEDQKEAEQAFMYFEINRPLLESNIATIEITENPFSDDDDDDFSLEGVSFDEVRGKKGTYELSGLYDHEHQPFSFSKIKP